MSKKTYYVVVPAKVKHDKRLSANAKLLCGEISALAGKEGFCWAGPKYFAEMFEVSERTVFNWLKELEGGGYIQKRDGKEGRIIVLDRQKVQEVTEKNFSARTEKNFSNNNTSINNTGILSSSLNDDDGLNSQTGPLNDDDDDLNPQTELEFFTELFFERMESAGAGRGLIEAPELKAFADWILSRSSHKVNGADMPTERVLDNLLRLTPKLFYEELDKACQAKIAKKEGYLLTCIINRLVSGLG